MRAVYVPASVVAGTPAWFVAEAPAIEAGGTLTVCLTVSTRLRTTVVTLEHLRYLLRRWAAADRDGYGTLEIGD